MTKRNYPDWLSAYTDYASFTESPARMHYWSGISALAGAIQRKLWINQEYYEWTPGFYIIFVAPPGIVAKSTTADTSMRILRQVPGVKFGPSAVTMPALVEAFEGATEGFELAGEFHTQSALTLVSSEMGNLVKPDDTEMIDLLVELWDGRRGNYEKKTKFSGNNNVQNPWINLIACTTPAWIAGNFPTYAIGGGFTSRCVFVYAEKKGKLVAYPKLVAPKDIRRREQSLLEDLLQVYDLKGEVELTPAAYKWGTEWHLKHNTESHGHLDPNRFGGYVARKQAHMHKLALILSASEGNSMMIDVSHLQRAELLITELEDDLPKVFGHIGKDSRMLGADRLVDAVIKFERIEVGAAYRMVHNSFPSYQQYGDILIGLLRSNQLRMVQVGNDQFLIPPAVLPVAVAVSGLPSNVVPLQGLKEG